MSKDLKKIYLYVGVIMAVLVVGVSYAYFTAGIQSETSTSINATGGVMKINYSGGASINLSGVYPRDEVWATKTITVTGNNTSAANMYYKLRLVIDSNTFVTSDPLQYELVSTNTSKNGTVIASKAKTNLTASVDLGTGNFVQANNAKHTYSLKIYYPKKTTAQDSNQGAAFSAHVEITAVNG